VASRLPVIVKKWNQKRFWKAEEIIRGGDAYRDKLGWWRRNKNLNKGV